MRMAALHGAAGRISLNPCGIIHNGGIEMPKSKSVKPVVKSKANNTAAVAEFLDNRRHDSEDEVKSTTDWLGRWWSDTDAFLENWLGTKEDMENEVKAKGYDMAVRELVGTVRSINMRAKATLMVIDDLDKGRAVLDAVDDMSRMLKFEELVDVKARVMGGWL